jgi:hypothetical protein
MTRDLRKYTKQTNARLMIGAFVLLYVVGTALIYSIYGTGAAVMGLLCLLAALVPMGLIALAMWIIDYVAKKANEE